MDLADRIPLARTRRRRPKPLLYWIVVAFLVVRLGMLFTSVLSFLDNGTPANAMRVGANVLFVTFCRLLARQLDPDDDYRMRRSMLLLAPAAVILDIARWCVFGLSAG